MNVSNKKDFTEIKNVVEEYLEKSDALTIVKKLNDKFPQETEDTEDYNFLLSYSSNGEEELIEYLGQTIWDSVNYSRINLETFIKKEINILNKTIGKIKI